MNVIGQIKLSYRDSSDKLISENLGYTNGDATTTPTLASALKTYSQGLASLTINVYRSTSITYDVTLDEMEAE